MKYFDVKAMASLWGLTKRRVTALCRNGRINGAKKEGGLWLIPESAEKPCDERRKKYSQAVDRTANLPLPLGESDFRKIVDSYYYVDKTLMLKEFMDSRPKVSLFTRPRRFGKTLTMDMFKTFFEISETDNSKYFKNKKIWSCGEMYRREQGKYPLIFLSFKDVKHPSWKETYQALKKLIADECLRHNELASSSVLSDYQKKRFELLATEAAGEIDYQMSLRTLTLFLHKHHKTAPIIIIDEYDTPIQQGHINGFYDSVTGFMRNLFSGGLKDNPNLSFGFLTGILRIAKESIFSGLNNLAVHSVLDDKYSEYFGFTPGEVKEMTEYFGVLDKYEDICEWYDGYRFGNRDIFNPWSVINYFYNNCFPKAYWQSTGDNGIIRQIVAKADEETADNLRQLMQGQTISSYVDTSVIYPDIKSNPTTIYSFLLASGYLKTVRKENIQDGDICDIAIPNKEIYYVYEKEILSVAFSITK